MKQRAVVISTMLLLVSFSLVSIDGRQTGFPKQLAENGPLVHDPVESGVRTNRSKPVQTDRNPISLFDIAGRQNYQPFRGETCRSENGFGIYSENAAGGVMTDRLRSGKILTIYYSLPPLNEWGNWFGIRKEFLHPLDVRGYRHIDCEIMVIKPSGARLRISLCDVEKTGDINRHGRDEIWWYDLPGDLSRSGGGWEKIRVDIRDMLYAGGYSRHNNMELDLAGIAAFQLDVIVDGVQPDQEGLVSIRDLRIAE